MDLIVAGGLAIALTSVLVVARPWQHDSEGSTTNAPVKSFLLRIDSTPSGAEVREKDRVLGKTPFELRVDSAHSFTLALAGYRPYAVEQPTPTADVHVRADLIAAAPAQSITTLPEPSVGRPPTTRTWTKPSTRDKPPGKPNPGTDIRLER